MKVEEKIAPWNATKVRMDFPLLQQKINGKPLVYFDNGASSQKPQSVIDAITTFYSQQNANVHRGVYTLSQIATDAYDQSREKLAKYIGAPHAESVIFTSGTTDSINLVAQAWGRDNLKPGDELICTEMEHHSNMVPWQMIAKELGVVLKYIPIKDNGTLDMQAYDRLLNPKVKLVTAVHISNTLGIVNPVEDIIEKAHAVGAKVLIDGAQAVAHKPVDVAKLDCDFYAFSGHKILGPTGIGILYGKREILEKTRPYKGGGDMIDRVTLKGTTYAALPFRFEAGTPNIAGAIGLGAAIDYLHELDWSAIATYEEEMLNYFTRELCSIEGMTIYGTEAEKVPVISFRIKDLHPFDVATLLDQMGMAVRTGHHCTQPLMDRFQITGTIRASLAFYNTFEEIDSFVTALKKAIQILRK